MKYLILISLLVLGSCSSSQTNKEEKKEPIVVTSSEKGLTFHCVPHEAYNKTEYKELQVNLPSITPKSNVYRSSDTPLILSLDERKGQTAYLWGRVKSDKNNSCENKSTSKVKTVINHSGYYNFSTKCKNGKLKYRLENIDEVYQLIESYYSYGKKSMGIYDCKVVGFNE